MAFVTVITDADGLQSFMNMYSIKPFLYVQSLFVVGDEHNNSSQTPNIIQFKSFEFVAFFRIQTT